MIKIERNGVIQVDVNELQLFTSTVRQHGVSSYYLGIPKVIAQHLKLSKGQKVDVAIRLSILPDPPALPLPIKFKPSTPPMMSKDIIEAFLKSELTSVEISLREGKNIYNYLSRHPYNNLKMKFRHYSHTYGKAWLMKKDAY